MMGRFTAGVALIAVAACARPAAPAADTAQVQGAEAAPAGGVTGTWVHRTMPVTYLETVTLRTSGEQVTGEGTYMMEAGRAGKSTVSGTWKGGVLTLRITRDGGVAETFTGRMESADRLAGTLSTDGQPAQPFAYERQKPGT